MIKINCLKDLPLASFSPIRNTFQLLKVLVYLRNLSKMESCHARIWRNCSSQLKIVV